MNTDEMYTSMLRFDSPEQELYLNLWRTFDRLRSLEDEVFAPFGISAQQYNALRLLRSVHPGSLPTLTLAARLISRAPDITRLVDRLVHRNLVERDRSEVNRRVVQLRITPAGLAMLSDLSEAVQELHRKQVGHLTEEERDLLTDLLKHTRSPHETELSFWKPEPRDSHDATP
jgi:DNA-binding MarR family transcriptional regulator